MGVMQGHSSIEWAALGSSRYVDGRQMAPQVTSTCGEPTEVQQMTAEAEDQQLLMGASEWFAQVGQLEGLLSQLDGNLDHGPLLASRKIPVFHLP